ncbi:MAG: DUF1559 domain-containing protein [Isosphaeraceae bacterium]
MLTATSLMLAIGLGLPGWAAPQDSPAGEIAPLLYDDVVAVARVELDQLDLATLQRLYAGGADAAGSDVLKSLSTAFESLKKSGVKRIYALVDPADVPGIPILAAAVPDGADADAIKAQLRQAAPKELDAEVRKGFVVVATRIALDRLAAAKPATTLPGLATALASVKGSTAQVVVLPSETLRRSLEESLPTLPPELGGGSSTPLVRGVKWLVAGLDTSAKPRFRLVVQGGDADSVKSVITVVDRLLKLAGEQPELKALAKELSSVLPDVNDQQLVYNVDLTKALAVVKAPIDAVQDSARRTECMNNLKMIGLAMHNYHDTHGTFPPAVSRDKAGKPLLSWRVHILPFLDQAALYQQFHLDEPWDSPHNRALISKMPATYACGSANPALAREGKTTYVVASGKATAFPPDRATRIADFTDGTSNTILIFQTVDDRAVVWTQPADYEVKDAADPKVLATVHRDLTTWLTADGAAHMKKRPSAETFLIWLTRNGGEVVPADN